MPGPFLLLFDVDGTLLRTDGAGLRAFNRGIEEAMGWTGALAGVSLAGMTDSAIVDSVSRRFQGRPLSAPEREKIYSRYLAALGPELARSEGYRILPGVRDFLRACHGRPHLLLGLGTGNLETGARLKLERGGLNHFFPFGGFGSDAEQREDLLRIAVRRGEARWNRTVPEDHVIIIGDTPRDVSAGKIIGAKTLGVATGPFSEACLREAGADWVFPDLTRSEPLREALALE